MSKDNYSRVPDFNRDEERQGLPANDENVQFQRHVDFTDPLIRSRGAIILSQNENDDYSGQNDLNGCKRWHDDFERKVRKYFEELKDLYFTFRKAIWFDLAAGAFLLVFVPVVGAVIVLFGTGLLLYGAGLFLKGLGELLTFGLLHRHYCHEKNQPELPLPSNNRINPYSHQNGSV